MNLDCSDQFLWSNIRKSYKQLIRWGDSNLDIYIYFGDSITWQEFQKFIDLHIVSASRITRCEETWRCQFKLIQNYKAFYICGYLHDKLVTSSLYTIKYDSAYYAVSASDRTLFEKPLMHALMWSAIKFSKLQNLKYFNLGNVYPDAGNVTVSQKESQIGLFKAGFGGCLHPQLTFESSIQ